NGLCQKRLPDPLPYLFGRAIVILEIDVGVQADDPAYVLLAAPAGGIAKRADAEVKPHPRLVVPLQEGLYATGLARRQALNGAVRPQRGEEDRALGRPLEQRGERVDRRVDVDHIGLLAKKAPAMGPTPFSFPRGLQGCLAALLRLFAAVIFEGGRGVVLVEHRRSRQPVHAVENGVVDRAALAVGVLVGAYAELHDR